LSEKRIGIHPLSARRDPDPALLERLLGAGPVRLMTLAPALPGGDELIGRLLLGGVAVSCGHTDATAEEAAHAFDRGVRTVTHLFNAMRPFRHRDPGLAGAALARDDVVVQIILDGVHLAEETARMVWKSAAGRVALVTDAVAAAGIGDGDYMLGGSAIEVRDGVARGLDDVLAGSALTMIEAVRNLHGLGIPLAEAVAAATQVPARILAQPDLGRLDVGLPADLVVLDDNLEIERVWLGGEAHVVACAGSSGRRRRRVPHGDPAAAAGAEGAARARARIRAGRNDGSRTRCDDRAHGRPRLVRQRHLVRRLRLRTAAPLDGPPRLDCAHGLL